jgi:hypothetical protein
MIFSARYLPTTLFSLKDSRSTNSGAKSLFLPSSYAIKMALLNQAITIGGDIEKLETKNSKEFTYIRDTKITFHICDGSNFCVNNSFVRILKPARDGRGLQQTVAFREYVFLSHPVEIIFAVKDENAKNYLKQYLHKINYFGKRGCFFQFLEYLDKPNETNVKTFDIKDGIRGILQEYDDFDVNSIFENVSNSSSSISRRKKEIFVLPISRVSSSKSFSHYTYL